MGAGRVLSGMAAGLLMISPVVAAETITYTYDAKGRLVKVKRTGTVNNNVTVDYEHDKANNRTRLKVTNSPNPPPRSEEHTSELQSLMRISYAVFCLKKKISRTQKDTKNNRSKFDMREHIYRTDK